MTDAITLIGFIADLNGNEDNLISAEPVVRVHEKEFVAHGVGWDIDSLRPLLAEQRQYVRMLKPAAEVSISPGEYVWLAGPNLVSGIALFRALRGLSLELHSTWALHARGYKWRVGTDRQFLDLKTKSANLMERVLHQMLFDSLEKSHGDAKRAFDLYSAMDTIPSRNRLLNRALFYVENTDAYGLAMTRERAIQSGFFQSRDEFEKCLNELRESLMLTRLSAVAAGASANQATEDASAVNRTRARPYVDALGGWTASEVVRQGWENHQVFVSGTAMDHSWLDHLLLFEGKEVDTR